MSLINDAIKRASENQPPAPPPQASDVQLEPVPPRKRFTLLLWCFPVAILFTISMCVLFIVKGLQSGLRVDASERQQPIVQPAPATPQATPPPPTPAPTPAIAPTATPGGSTATTPTTPPATETPSAPIPAPSATSTPANTQPRLAVDQTEPETFPQLRLQGIYYRPSNPSVVINNETLFRGDRIRFATVTQITRDSVTLVWKDQTNVLTLR